MLKLTFTVYLNVILHTGIRYQSKLPCLIKFKAKNASSVDIFTLKYRYLLSLNAAVGFNSMHVVFVD